MKITDSNVIPEDYTEQILVPFSPESVLSGVNHQLLPKEVLWYRRKIRIDEMKEAQRCILHFGAVDQKCEVFINHRKVREHIGGYLPFELDITEYIKKGENQIEVCVTDESDTSYHSKGKQKLERGGMFYTAQSGIWQTVWMEWVPNHYIQSLKIEPRYDSNEVCIEITPSQAWQQNTSKFQVEIYEGDCLSSSVESETRRAIVKLKNRISWSPENPYLYRVIIKMEKDVVESYFAMRKIEVVVGDDQIPRIYLNNEFYFQNGVLDQGYWPDGLYTAPCDEAFVYDIMKMKELGFNMIRKHIKIEPLRWYYHCDRLGMLVWQDMVNGGEAYHPLYVTYLPTILKKMITMKDNAYRMTSRKNKKGREEWLEECKETVKHLYNCPCIVTWVPFNEGWGQFDAKDATVLIRSVDKTRLVDHASGWFDQGDGDVKSVHNYFRKLEVELDHRAFVISEFGGYACKVPDHFYSERVYGYKRYDSQEELAKDYKKLMEIEIHQLIEKGLSASVYTQLSDVEDEVNGLLTYDRKITKVPPVHLL